MKEKMNGGYPLQITRVTEMGTALLLEKMKQLYNCFQDTGYQAMRNEKQKVNPKKWETDDMSPMTDTASRPWLWEGKLRHSL